MDDRQQRIYEALLVKRPDLASMYRTALRLLAETPKAGEERTRISHVCHSMREVMNRVLSEMGTARGPQVGVGPSSREQVQALPDLLSQFPELSLDGNGDSIPIPRAIATVFQELIKSAVQEKGRSRDDIASLLTDDGNGHHLAVKRWMNTRTFFVKWAHLHAQAPDVSKLPSDDTLRENIAVFDELFDDVITKFFERLHTIEDLLADINEIQESEDE